MVRFVPLGTSFLRFKGARGEGEIVRRERNEVAQGGVSYSQAGTHYEVIDSVELARRWVHPVSWVRGHVRSRVTDPLRLGWETGIENAPKLEYNNLQRVGTL
jgi:hypothetical protein